jgi:ADP-ribosyl-[dinitrogen reductase] hydrolase
MDWEKRVLEALEASRPDPWEPPNWRSALALYEELSAAEAEELDRTLLRMIDLSYRNPHAEPVEGVSLPNGMRPGDLLCLEAAVLVAAERGLAGALFPLNRLLRTPTWHPLSTAMHWLGSAAFDVQRRLSVTRAGRYLGAMLGLAAGDALGATLEFMSREQVKARYPEVHRDLLGGGPFDWAPGAWTDDTQMAACVARGILKNPTDPVPAVGEEFMDWFKSGPADVGNTIRRALSLFPRLGSWDAVSEQIWSELGERAGGNGALMRTLPAHLAYGAKDPRPSRIGWMTHPTKDSEDAIRWYGGAVAVLLAGGTKDEAFATLEMHPRLTDYRESVAPPSTGYVWDTLNAALWAFWHGQSLEETMVLAANLGGDADTVGAVVGGLAGAHWGPLAIPRRWSLKLEGRAELERLAEGLWEVSQSIGSDSYYLA